jgi:hypothetical protein
VDLAETDKNGNENERENENENGKDRQTELCGIGRQSCKCLRIPVQQCNHCHDCIVVTGSSWGFYEVA